MLLICATMMISSNSYEGGDDEEWEKGDDDGDGGPRYRKMRAVMQTATIKTHIHLIGNPKKWV